MEDFKNWLRKARIYHGYSPKELAEMLDVNKSSVCRWEQGANKPRSETYELLKEILKGYKSKK